MRQNLFLPLFKKSLISERNAVLSALSLSRFLILFPQLIPQYTDEIIYLLKFDKINNSDLDPMIESWGLSYLLRNELNYLINFVEGQGGAIVTSPSAVILGMFKQLNEQQSSQLLLFNYVLDKADFQVDSRDIQTGTKENRYKIRLWQGLLLLAPSVKNDQKETALKILGFLERIEAPNVKHLQEQVFWILLSGEPSLFRELIIQPLRRYETRTESIPTLIILGLRYLFLFQSKEQEEQQNGGEDQQQQQYVQLQRDYVDSILPWATHHHHLTRTFAVLALQMVFQELGTWEDLSTLAKFCQTNEEMAKMRPKIGELVFIEANSHSNSNLNLTSNSLKVNSLSNTKTKTNSQLQYKIDKSTLDQHPDQLENSNRNATSNSNTNLSQYFTGDGTELGLIERIQNYLAQERNRMRAERNMSDVIDHSIETTDKNFTSYQRKFVPTIQRFSAFELEKQAGIDGEGGLVLVASLLDRTPNLAGLCRTCEIFGARVLTVNSLQILKDSLFKEISVSADKWVKIQEVPMSSLMQWLIQKRTEGYSLVGLEQTRESVNLPQFQFERKTCLVLGKEKEGIPVQILRILNSTIEIPQFGVIRSLNVHVSGAVAMYEYARQHLCE